MSKLHPIQLKDILVEELELKIRDITKAREENVESVFTLKTAHSEYTSSSEILYVGVIGEINSEDEFAPVYLKVKLHGVFSVDEAFPEQFVHDWAEKNAPLILIPFVRENIYSLASRAKVNTIVPLFTLPSVKKISDSELK
ncbi:protein-export chaperone SecB [Actinobacillus porcinus]|uniref:Preprotein translocase subunit SecB n=1 Tax=Actinobacillus porcinus TaxID=51048 RepID=A0ABY6TJX2_9PAST|nr:protein-export chaperone SecB [Actinobacillus porcinus]MDD7544843.1 protein-export chaperone SecB [Actinobacillus porcinus]MDY5847238.1 protein-export chaperone SecB [Actinobacillus porcinus]VFY92730.1 Preprotein translocase subunit SecB [Actinobacillus porcinus]VTU07198.1 Preprotein translocase subunit SecB [Actinobacillus porcinus]